MPSRRCLDVIRCRCSRCTPLPADLAASVGFQPISKLERSVKAAEQLGAQTVVVHPPFRWQRRYAEGFSDQVMALEAASEVLVAVENMFRSALTGFSGRSVAPTDAQARRRPWSRDFGVRAVLRPAGRRARALHAGSVAHLHRRHRCAGHGRADGLWAGASAPV